MTVARPHGSILHGMSAVQAHLPAAAAAGLRMLALAAAALPGLWTLTRHVNTMAHEGAHAAMGSATGRTIRGVTINGDGTGVTAITADRGVGLVLAAAVGYLGPSAFGLGAAELIRVGHPVAVLWIALAALAILAVLARRSVFGITAAVGTGCCIYLVARYAPVGAAVALAYVMTWFLLLSGLRVVMSHGRNGVDATILRQLTRMPRGLWAGLWLIGSGLALFAGGRMLL
jgi:Peptidase M50B-like